MPERYVDRSDGLGLRGVGLLDKNAEVDLFGLPRIQEAVSAQNSPPRPWRY